MSTPVKATVVCGPLGSGKTTYLSEALRTTRERVAVLVNDFGQMGIDGEILSVTGVPVIELPSGCVCCTLRMDLITTLQRILEEIRPDHVMIEPSGMASPSGVLDALEAVGVSPVNVIGILDATEFLDMHESGMFGRFLTDQVTQADVVLVNKADLAGTVRVAETMEFVAGLNPAAVVLPTVKTRTGHPLEIPEANDPKPRGHDVFAPDFESFSSRLPTSLGLEDVQSLLERLGRGDYGTVVRAKALVQTPDGGFRADLASGSVMTEPLAVSVSEGRIVVIGRRIDQEALKQVLAEYRTF